MLFRRDVLYNVRGEKSEFQIRMKKNQAIFVISDAECLYVLRCVCIHALDHTQMYIETYKKEYGKKAILRSTIWQGTVFGSLHFYAKNITKRKTVYVGDHNDRTDRGYSSFPLLLST